MYFLLLLKIYILKSVLSKVAFQKADAFIICLYYPDTAAFPEDAFYLTFDENMGGLKDFIADLFTCLGLYLTKIQYVKKCKSLYFRKTAQYILRSDFLQQFIHFCEYRPP